MLRLPTSLPRGLPTALPRALWRTALPWVSRVPSLPCLSAARLSTSAAANPVALCETSMGTFKVELFVDVMPITASNFIDLAKTGFYDGVHFHRVIPMFMAQFGCPNARDLSGNSGMPGTGGPPSGSKFKLHGSSDTVTRAEFRGKGVIPDEHTAKISNSPGTLSMANAGPNSGGSQFFINVASNARLDWFSPGPSQHPVFGRVVDGYEVVVAITEVAAGETGRDRPNTPIKMLKVTVEES
jgi:cyclophilin family peptidyl-prolyl cis-trans isomerase